MIHPVIRVISFLVFAAYLSRPHTLQLITAAFLLSGLFIFTQAKIKHALSMLLRLRWLFLSIVIIYGWFTPGETFLFDSTWFPTIEGLQQGVVRVSALILIVMAVSALIAVNNKQQLLTAICWLSYPLKWFGISRERLAIRMALTFNAVAEFKTLFSSTHSTAEKATWKVRLKTISQKLTDVYLAALRKAERESEIEMDVHLEKVTSPPVYQWSYIAALIILFAAMGIIELNHLHFDFIYT